MILNAKELINRIQQEYNILHPIGEDNSYYVCNCEPTGVLIDTLRSIDFFALRDAMNLSASLREPSHISMR